MDPVNRENSETHFMGHNGGGRVRVAILDIKKIIIITMVMILFYWRQRFRTSTFNEHKPIIDGFHRFPGVLHSVSAVFGFGFRGSNIVELKYKPQ